MSGEDANPLNRRLPAEVVTRQKRCLPSNPLDPTTSTKAIAYLSPFWTVGLLSKVILYVDCWGAVTVHCFSCKKGYRLLLSLLQILNLGALCQGEVKKIVENNDEAGAVGVNSPTQSPYQLFERRRFRWISKLLCR